MSLVRGRNVSEMSPDERLDALAEILAIGLEKSAQILEEELDAARQAMAPCVHAVNGQRPAAGVNSND